MRRKRCKSTPSPRKSSRSVKATVQHDGTPNKKFDETSSPKFKSPKLKLFPDDDSPPKQSLKTRENIFEENTGFPSSLNEEGSAHDDFDLTALDKKISLLNEAREEALRKKNEAKFLKNLELEKAMSYTFLNGQKMEKKFI